GAVRPRGTDRGLAAIYGATGAAFRSGSQGLEDRVLRSSGTRLDGRRRGWRTVGKTGKKATEVRKAGTVRCDPSAAKSPGSRPRFMWLKTSSISRMRNEGFVL